MMKVRHTLKHSVMSKFLTSTKGNTMNNSNQNQNPNQKKVSSDMKPTGRVFNIGGGYPPIVEYTRVNSVQCAVCGTWTESKVCLQCGACVSCGE